MDGGLSLSTRRLASRASWRRCLGRATVGEVTQTRCSQTRQNTHTLILRVQTIKELRALLPQHAPIRSSSLPNLPFGDNHLARDSTAAGNATVSLRTSTGTLTPPPPPRSSACLHRTDDALTPASGASFPWGLRLWQSLRWSPDGTSNQRRRVVCAGFWGLHERSDGADGVSSGQERGDGWAGVYGAKRKHEDHVTAIWGQCKRAKSAFV